MLNAKNGHIKFRDFEMDCIRFGSGESRSDPGKQIDDV